MALTNAINLADGEWIDNLDIYIFLIIFFKKSRTTE